MPSPPSLFRLNGAVRQSPEVDAWLARPDGELRGAARAWFEQMRACGDDVLDLIHDGGAVACVQDAPFGYVNVFAAHVNVGFFYGSSLSDPAGLLQGTGRRMRHAKLRLDQPPDAEALTALIAAAYEDIQLRLFAG